jgi:hypothetical protein
MSEMKFFQTTAQKAPAAKAARVAKNAKNFCANFARPFAIFAVKCFFWSPTVT